MKILITGANGMLAKAVKNRFDGEELILTDVDELDITDEKAVDKFVKEVNPYVVINCAAYTAVDKAEEEEDLAMKINCEGPKNLALACRQTGCRLVHISTDYVFGGDLPIDKFYLEHDATNPETVYGITKLEGEKAIKSIIDNYYIFRTAWLYGDGNNFVRTMLKLGMAKDQVKVVHDQYGSPTYTEDLADIIYQALEKKIPCDIYHATNLGFTTWYDFTKRIYKKADISCEIIPVTSEEFVRPAKRPKNSMMAKGKLLSTGVEIPGWQDGLDRYLTKELNGE